MRRRNCGEHPEIRDYGCEPFIFNINHATNMNEKFPVALRSSFLAGHRDAAQYIRAVPASPWSLSGCSLVK